MQRLHEIIEPKRVLDIIIAIYMGEIQRDQRYKCRIAARSPEFLLSADLEDSDIAIEPIHITRILTKLRHYLIIHTVRYLNPPSSAYRKLNAGFTMKVENL